MKTKLVLMFNGRQEYSFYTDIEKPKKKDLLTIKIKKDKYITYTVKFIQYFFDDMGEFQYLMVTAIRKY